MLFLSIYNRSSLNLLLLESSKLSFRNSIELNIEYLSSIFLSFGNSAHFPVANNAILANMSGMKTIVLQNPSNERNIKYYMISTG